MMGVVKGFVAFAGPKLGNSDRYKVNSGFTQVRSRALRAAISGRATRTEGGGQPEQRF